jgi:xanthine dehydrogenase accessory factor
MVAEALARLEAREAFSIGFDVPRSTAKLSPDAGRQTGLDDGVLHRRYLPRTRLLLAGRGPDFETVARVAAAAEFEVAVLSPDEDSLNALADLGGTRMTAPGAPPDLPIDPWTATVLMFHEHEWENALLARAAAAPGFYVGALGSVRTHRERVERLRAMGVPDADIARIKGPIGLIDRARDPGTLALSILAEVSAARAALDRT